MGLGVRVELGLGLGLGLGSTAVLRAVFLYFPSHNTGSTRGPNQLAPISMLHPI